MKYNAPPGGIDVATLQPEQRIMLRWNGYGGVPQWLAGSMATFVRRTKQGSAIVIADRECDVHGRTVERRVRPDQILVEVQK